MPIKSQSGIRRKSHINCIKPLRYDLVHILKDLEQLEEVLIDKVRTTVLEARSPMNTYHRVSFCLSSFGIKVSRLNNPMVFNWMPWRKIKSK